jgi:hypothetical protein
MGGNSMASCADAGGASRDVAAEARAISEHLEWTEDRERKDQRNNMSDSRYATRTGSQSDAYLRRFADPARPAKAEKPPRR